MNASELLSAKFPNVLFMLVIYEGLLSDEAIVTVEKVTKNYIYAEGIRYRKSDGYPLNGNVWSNYYIRCATADEIKKVVAERDRIEIIEYRKRLDKRTFKHPLKGKALIGRIKYSNQQLKEE